MYRVVREAGVREKEGGREMERVREREERNQTTASRRDLGTTDVECERFWSFTVYGFLDEEGLTGMSLFREQEQKGKRREREARRVDFLVVLSDLKL